MKREFLKSLNIAGLTDEIIGQIMAEHGKSIETIKSTNEMQMQEIASLKEQAQQSLKTIKELKSNNADNEELQKKIKEYETTIATQQGDYDNKIKELTFNTAIEKVLASSKAKHSDLLSSKIDKTKLTISEGKVIGLDEQVKELKTNYSDLFEEKLSGITPNNTGSSVPQANPNSWKPAPGASQSSQPWNRFKV